MAVPTRTALRTLGDVLSNADQLEWDGVLFLPADPASWTGDTVALVVAEDEVDENDRHAEADKHSLSYILGVSAVQDVKANALAQIPDADVDALVDALRFYFTRDAFADLT